MKYFDFLFLISWQLFQQPASQGGDEEHEDGGEADDHVAEAGRHLLPLHLLGWQGMVHMVHMIVMDQMDYINHAHPMIMLMKVVVN